MALDRKHADRAIPQLEKRIEKLESNGGGGVDIEVLKGLINDAIRADNELKYPVGKIIMETGNVNPATYLGFGTWEAWGAGRVPVGINASDTNFATVEKTGGSADSIVVTHTHAQVAHTHTVGNNSVSHTHSIPALSGTAASAGAHKHNTYRSQMGTSGSSLWVPTADESTSKPVPTSSNGAHTHTVSTKASTTGANSAAHTHTVNGGATTTGSAGSAGTGKNLQPYITCYMWKRTA